MVFTSYRQASRCPKMWRVWHSLGTHNYSAQATGSPVNKTYNRHPQPPPSTPLQPFFSHSSSAGRLLLWNPVMALLHQTPARALIRILICLFPCLLSALRQSRRALQQGWMGNHATIQWPHGLFGFLVFFFFSTASSHHVGVGFGKQEEVGGCFS